MGDFCYISFQHEPNVFHMFVKCSETFTNIAVKHTNSITGVGGGWVVVLVVAWTANQWVSGFSPLSDWGKCWTVVSSGMISAYYLFCCVGPHVYKAHVCGKTLSSIQQHNKRSKTLKLYHKTYLIAVSWLGYSIRLERLILQKIEHFTFYARMWKKYHQF